MQLIIELSIVIIVLLGFILFMIYKIINNGLKIYNIKFNEASKILKENLHKKYDVSLKIIEFLNKTIKIDEENIQDFLNTNLKNIEMEDLNDILINTDLYIEGYLEDNEKLVNDKVYKEIVKELDKLDVTINSTRKYYNDKVNEYNKLIKKFPYNLVNKMKKYPHRTKLTEQKKTELKILK